MKSKLIILISCCLGFGLLHAQDYMFSPVTIENGLSQSTVSAIAQDQKGFLWLGTQDGLNRFDGHEFKVYKKDPFDTTSITDNFISALFVDEADNLWVGTMNGGLNLIDASREYILHFQHDRNDSTSLSDNRVSFIYQDAEKRIWVGTPKGFDEVIVGEDSKIAFQHHRFLNVRRGKSFGLRGAMQDRKGRWWISTLDELHCCRLNNDGDFVAEKDSLHEWLQTDGKKWSLFSVTPCEDRLGRLWIGSAKGLIAYDPQQEEIKIHSVGSENQLTREKAITNITLDKKGNLLVMTNHSLYINKFKDGAYAQDFQALLPDNQEEHLRLRDPNCLLADFLHDDLYWIGTDMSGLMRIHKKRKKFNTQRFLNLQRYRGVTPSVFHIDQDTSGVLWLGMPRGLVRYDRDKESYRLIEDIQIGQHKIRTGSLNALYRDKAGTLWMGSYSGLLRMKPGNEKELHADHYLEGFECESPAVFSIYEEEGLLYLGAFGGINFLDKTTNTILPCPLPLDTLGHSGFNYQVNAFLRDKQNNFWIGTSQGLIFYQNLKGSLRDNLDRIPQYYRHDQQNKTSLIDNQINDIHQDGNGYIWLATMNGLVRATPNAEGMQFENFNETNGLINNVVYGMLEEEGTHCLWLSTNNGLCRFDPVANRFFTFDSGDGLQSNEFNANAFYKNKQGEFFFGGIKGLTSFFPGQIHLNKKAPPVYLTELKTSKGQIHNLLGKEEMQWFKLPYDENSFSLHFTGLDYLSPSGVAYYYDLEGTATRDMHIGNSRHLNFNSLAPGVYKVCINAGNKDGFVNGESATVGIVICAPYWQRGWFYALIGLSALLLISGIYYTVYRIKMRRLAEIEEVRKLAAQDFHDELGSKLTVISMYSELTRNQLTEPHHEVQTYLGKVISTSNSLYDSMKDLLWALNPEQDTINDLFFQLKDFGEELFSHSGVIFQSQGLDTELVGTQLLPMQFKRHLLLIFKEAMNNSLRHAKAKSVQLRMSTFRDVLTIEIGDDGKGFQQDHENSGEGLRNMQSRARKISGKLFISSEKEGTLVKLVCPLN